MSLTMGGNYETGVFPGSARLKDKDENFNRYKVDNYDT